MRRLLTSLMIAVALMNSAPAFAMQTVPAGNRHAEQPDIPGASIRRTKGTKSSFDLKYEKVHELLATDRELMSKIRKISSAYGINPIHVVGAIVGEHTYNVDAYDRLQAYYVKAASYAGESFRFSYDGESVDEFVARPQFSECKGKSDSYTLWSCREDVWETDFRGKTVGGTSFPNNRFSAVFFQPFYAGQTFGLGQVNPLTALMLSDLVTRVSGYPKLNEKNAGAVYRAIMDPDISLAFVAASIRRSIDDYKEIAGMDISGNPGLTATLYNVGNSRQRAAALAAKNRGAGATVWPEENYYGWLINDKLDELKGLL
ncbi:DUF1402 family protein [Rhizobium leguminosarum]|uniref:DUF1402 family protein n=1 Tax=Rhizobium leguminosarum TaxID=384 RepID=UPI001A918AD7|nr:DUF1402 family protein [Rhizobium leguminosarum]MBY5544573.1 DUF1402 family protein [Rhizobium leguminosarum]MBY5554793.1 DUF1402 family protein [Rhizobium leguminosarum]MBY5635536.1 DUF1402 family protein [Rhizobium leguminosarum]MBY5664656.1 DUF1402 family protein [Rhizobium leguminosarum]MBY5678521.1 DUF1402 family protein [Rhizobium leguminosarum]